MSPGFLNEVLEVIDLCLGVQVSADKLGATDAKYMELTIRGSAKTAAYKLSDADGNQVGFRLGKLKPFNKEVLPGTAATLGICQTCEEDKDYLIVLTDYTNSTEMNISVIESLG